VSLFLRAAEAMTNDAAMPGPVHLLDRPGLFSQCDEW
jgi:hypothetical protein